MDFLNRAYAQLVEQYRLMTPSSRLTVVLLFAVVVGSLGFLYSHPIASPSEDLLLGMQIPAGQMPRMLHAFQKANLTSHELKNDSIFVPRDQKAAYMAALVEHKALPPNFGDALRDAVDSGAFYEDSRRRDQRLKNALQETLAQVICEKHGIERACVIFDVGFKSGFSKEKIFTAMVSVKSLGSTQLDEVRVKDIRYLIAGSMAGLKPEDVTVADLNGRTWYGKLDDSADADEKRYISLKRLFEEELKAKILNALGYIPNVTVAPTVVLDCEPLRHGAANNTAPVPRARDEGEKPAAPQANTTVASGVDSREQQPNRPSVIDSLLPPASREETGNVASSGDAAEAKNSAAREPLGFAPRSARVSVGMPMSYLRVVWQQRNPPLPGQPAKTPDQVSLDRIREEEIAKIQRHVAQLLPQADAVATASQVVTVTTFESPSAQESPSAILSRDVLNWLQESWKPVSAVVLAFLGLLVLRSMVRSARPVSRTAVSTPKDTDVEPRGLPHAVVPAPHARRFHQSSPSIHDELSEFVEDDPDAAANVLRSWIGS